MACLPQDLPTVNYRYTEAVHCQGSSWSLPSLAVTTKGSRMHHGGNFAKPLHQSSGPVRVAG